jgi:hypothetical protein
MSEVDRIVFGTPVVERPFLVAVDGVDGSEKTTYAATETTAQSRRQAWMGHESIATTNRYLHFLGTGADLAGLDRLNATSGGAGGTKGGEW